MGTPVHVGVQRPLVIEEHAFDAILPIAQGKLLGHTGRKLADFANQFSFGFFLVFKLMLVAQSARCEIFPSGQLTKTSPWSTQTGSR